MTILPNGIAILEYDLWLSKWVKEQGTLKVADSFCRLFSPYIPKGGTVCDVGACIGDHTATYSEMVGINGLVFAFEPNPEAFECLKHNFKDSGNVVIFSCGLGDDDSFAYTWRSDDKKYNIGATQLKPLEDKGNVPPGASTAHVRTLDSISEHWGRLDFLKIDAEGWEPLIIKGARKTLDKFKPTILVEINKECLEPRGFSRRDIIDPLVEMGYKYKPAEPHYDMDGIQVDVLFYR